MNADERKSSVNDEPKSVNIRASRKAEPPVLTEAERELKMTERSALIMQLTALDKYLGIKRRCKNCGNVL